MSILEDINWKGFGYPDLSETFERLSSKNEKDRDEVYNMLAYHYLRALTKITPYLVPYFIKLLDTAEIEEKDRIIGVLMDWTLSSIDALQHNDYKDYATNLLLEINKGVSIYQNIASTHEDEETRIGAQQLLNTLNRAK